jgi:surface protein
MLFVALVRFGLVALCVVRRMLSFVGLSQYFDQGSSFRLLFLRVDCECNRPFFLVTAFNSASAFNGELSRWDVAKVTTMSSSKSICISENVWT